jgi:antitoxin CptB
MEDRETRLKRLKIRSWRRGTKEMDLVLGPYADTHMWDLTDAELDQHESMMAEHDQDLYMWVSGQVPAPEEHKVALERISRNFMQNK